MGMSMKSISESTELVASQVVDAAFKVHSTLGPGLLESVYEACLEHELKTRGFDVARQVTLPVQYNDIIIDVGFRLDLLVSNCVIVELKAVESLLPVHKAQILTYLKLSGHRLGFLINFNTHLLKDGIMRIVL
jgi:GxxExxY protein